MGDRQAMTEGAGAADHDPKLLVDGRPRRHISPPDHDRGWSGTTLPWGAILSPVALLAGYTAFALLLFRDSWAAVTTRVIGNGRADTDVTMWGMAWTPYALIHHHNPLHTVVVNWPDGINLMWTPPIYPVGLLMWPITYTVGPVAAFNVMTTAAVALSAWTAFLAIRRWVPSAMAAGAGGLLYGFSPFMMAHALGHLALILAFIPPLMLIVLDDVLVRQRYPFVQTGLALGALASLQLFIFPETLVVEGMVGAIGLLVLMLMRPRDVGSRLVHAFKAFTVGIVLFLIVVEIPLYYQFLGPQHLQHVHGVLRGGDDVYVTDLLNFFLPTDVQQFVPSFVHSTTQGFTGNMAEWNGYLGLPLIAIVMFVAFRHWPDELVRWSFLMLLAIMVLSLGPSLHVGGRAHSFPLPWRAVVTMPLLAAVLPARLMGLAYLFAGLLIAVFLADVVGPARVRTLAGLAVAALAALALLPTLHYLSAPRTPPTFFTDAVKRDIQQDSVALVAPYAYPLDDTAEYWQAVARMRFRMPEGYFTGAAPDGSFIDRPLPSATQQFMVAIQSDQPPPNLTSELKLHVRSELRGWGVQSVIVGPMDPAQRDLMVAYLTAILDRPPEQVEGVYLWRHISP